MNSSSRIIAVGGTIVVLILAFVIFRPGKDDKTPAATQTTAAGGTTTTGAPAQPQYTTIVVKGGQPVGGIKKIQLDKGDQARIEVTSPDTTSEIHLHGYDLKRDLKAGGSVRFNFPAKADGIYIIELEETGTQIGELRVEPN